MSSLRKERACTKESQLDRVDNQVRITTCLVEGRPGASDDDEKPRLSIHMRATKDYLAEWHRYSITVHRNGSRVIDRRLSGTAPDTLDAESHEFYNSYQIVLEQDFSPGEQFRIEYMALWNAYNKLAQTLSLRSNEDQPEDAGSASANLGAGESGVRYSMNRPASGVEYHLCVDESEQLVHLVSVCELEPSCPTSPITRNPSGASEFSRNRLP